MTRLRGAGRFLLLVTLLVGWAEAPLHAEPEHPGDLIDLIEPEIEPFDVAFGDLSDIRERRVLRILVPSSRTNFFFDKGRPRGFTFELLQPFVDGLNRGLRWDRHIGIRFLPVRRDQLIPFLVAGHGDIAAGNLTITANRELSIDFTQPLAENVSEILVVHRDGPPIASVEELSGRTVHVRASSSYRESLDALNVRLEAMGRPPVRLAFVEEFLEDDDLLEMLDARLIEFMVIDDYKRHLWDDLMPDLDFRTDLVLRDGAQTAWAVRKDSPELREALSNYARGLLRNRALLNILGRRYFMQNRWVRSPASATSTQRFQATVELFRRYGATYGIDWLALLAQAFQESGLDQSVVSPVGAIGIMQLLPTTAADPAIGIRDIHHVEQNIHAGTKYMRWLMDRYLSDPQISEQDRFFLALASYNAGPNRIRRLRERALKAELDPNVWFGNVEELVARHVGRETVFYVANISRTYVAYRLTMEHEAARRAPAQER